jgi:hypothetical protein
MNLVAILPSTSVMHAGPLFFTLSSTIQVLCLCFACRALSQAYGLCIDAREDPLRPVLILHVCTAVLLLWCRALSQAYGLCIDARGGFSGGTIASGFNQAESEAPAEVGRFMSDKYYLWPNAEK